MEPCSPPPDGAQTLLDLPLPPLMLIFEFLDILDGSRLARTCRRALALRVTYHGGWEYASKIGQKVLQGMRTYLLGKHGRCWVPATENERSKAENMYQLRQSIVSYISEDRFPRTTIVGITSWLFPVLIQAHEWLVGRDREEALRFAIHSVPDPLTRELLLAVHLGNIADVLEQQRQALEYGRERLAVRGLVDIYSMIRTLPRPRYGPPEWKQEDQELNSYVLEESKFPGPRAIRAHAILCAYIMLNRECHVLDALHQMRNRHKSSETKLPFPFVEILGLGGPHENTVDGYRCPFDAKLPVEAIADARRVLI